MTEITGPLGNTPALTSNYVVTQNASDGARGKNPRSASTLAKAGAWFLAIGAIYRLIATTGVLDWAYYSHSSYPFRIVHALTYWTVPGFGLILTLAHVVVLVLGLIFVLKGMRTGAYIAYGLQIALGLVGLVWAWTFLNVLRWFINDGYYYWGVIPDELRIAWLVGGVATIGALVAIAVGIRKAPSPAPKPSATEIAASRLQQEQAWRVAEIQKWEDAYRIAHNGEAPPAGFMPPIATSAPQNGTNLFAILALVFGIGGGLLGIVFGHLALSQIKRTGENGRGMAIAGLVMGYIGLTVLVAWLIFWIAIAFSSYY